ncbi:MAG: cysteine--tRNA ligase [Candidatus Iainarchaeum archaeon]|uniref:Cysteine--tRNA ligase n=1 Tax=Candidatus Iainarchaeum sp. TaxID=3101447 RepID=A0A7T9I1F4_9ARCH|nr:MAG: cysteine--tRNA ligase [Candidatus Diapherotrites archaeon]
MVIQFYNTLSRSKELFHKEPGQKVGMYCCGPTVYYFAHIGNLRPYVAWDVLRRLLEQRKFKVTHVMNITDVGHLVSDDDSGEDKIEKTAREQQKSPEEIADFYTDAFLYDLEKMRVQLPHHLVKARKHIPEMIALIQKLEKKGYTYTTPSGVYFDTQKFPQYGKMANLNMDELKAVRQDVERDDAKKHPADFRLWQLNQPHHLQQWDSPWGRGYPGWHIECSAMSMKYLGEHFDIHTGGNDHINIHHPNEIAQSEAATGKKFADYWLHSAFMRIDNQKMSKSLKNVYLIRDIENHQLKPLAYRFLLLTTHYRSELNFTWESIRAAQTTLDKWNEFIQRLQKYAGAHSNNEINALIAQAKEKVEASFDDDINTAEALGELSQFQRRVNGLMDQQKLSKADTRKILEFLQDVDEVLGVFDFAQQETIIPANVLQLAQQREAARKSKDWAQSDALRAQIEKEGFAVLDTKEGFELKALKPAH